MYAASVLVSSATLGAPLTWLRTEDERPGRSDRSEPEELVRERRPDRVLVCVACGQPVTRPSEAIEIGGEHRHVCVNPKGLAFDIGCFASAPGCVTVGPRESFWSWFPGHEWEIALCRGCGAHLGWSFHGAEGVFWGLVLRRLVARTLEEDGNG